MADVLDNIVVLRSVYGDVGQKYYFTPMKDPKTRRFPDHIRRVDSKGDMILSDADKNSENVLIPENRLFVITSGITFNLNDPYQKADWEAIQFCPIIAQSRDARDKNGNLLIDGPKAEGKSQDTRYGTAELFIERPGAETVKRVTKKKLIHEADTFIYGDPKGAEGRLQMAKLLGKSMRNAPDADVMDYLLEISHKEPEKILNLYRGDDLQLRLLFIDAKDKHVIYVKQKVYLYSEQQIPLGATDDAVILWMKQPQNKKILELIKRDTYPEFYGIDGDTEETPGKPKLSK